MSEAPLLLLVGLGSATNQGQEKGERDCGVENARWNGGRNDARPRPRETVKSERKLTHRWVPWRRNRKMMMSTPRWEFDIIGRERKSMRWSTDIEIRNTYYLTLFIGYCMSISNEAFNRIRLLALRGIISYYIRWIYLDKRTFSKIKGLFRPFDSRCEILARRAFRCEKFVCVNSHERFWYPRTHINAPQRGVSEFY